MHAIPDEVAGAAATVVADAVVAEPVLAPLPAEEERAAAAESADVAAAAAAHVVAGRAAAEVAAEASATEVRAVPVAVQGRGIHRLKSPATFQVGPPCPRLLYPDPSALGVSSHDIMEL